MNESVKVVGKAPSEAIEELIERFLKEFSPYEHVDGGKVILLQDEKSGAFYIPCHLKAVDVVGKTDFFATIDDSEDEELYKLNRDVTENESAFAAMVVDATAGRTFEDIVVEFDISYNPEVPLKIYGGQHRIKAIESAKKAKPDTLHGLRVYFGLTKEQKVEIASINNTSIVVSNDLLDRMKEQLMGSELRDFCQSVGLLQPNQDFADRKDPIIPTVRVARTLIVNFLKGKNAKPEDFHQPIVCKSGGMDSDYLEAREHIAWKDKDLIEVGRNYAKLNEIQRSKVAGRATDKNSEYARKALSLSVVASWGYAAGFYTNQKEHLKSLFNIVENLGDNDDPLNAKALSEARLKGIDPDTYRGLGARISADEMGRMLEVFFVFAEKASGKRITKDLANAAIQSFEAKKATNKAAKSLSRI
jgi:hypothetical protein